MEWEDIKACTLCGKPRKEILVLTQVGLNMHSRYQREDDTFENMNGLQKQTAEFFCEDCFSAFVQKMESLAAERQAAQTAV
ncbi:hypothetical protein NO1_2199 [Candidatus Termititenax aidoneus]|uniref:Uncharacterized protein n=1 Tax=Termititenax aidoneus TaxID=2218524 RepID=A0A388TDX6_TERA1|nr:hypothetical protein NO1_2199 [Candidatus Termititenax aidoneus]